MKNKSITLSCLLFVIIALIISSCTALASSKSTPTVMEPSATPVPLKEVTLCTADEPETLFYYGESSKGADLIFEAIYDGPFDWIDYLPEPVILEKVPTMSDGSASFIPVGVQGGDLIVDVEGNITNLTEGVRLFPRGCQSLDCAVTWDGVSQLQMDQLTLVYTIKEGVRWSDGENVKATDSQYAYRLAADLQNTEYEEIIDEIVLYEAVDERTIKVTTLPGLITPDYTSFFFSPLPQHIWTAYVPADLNGTDIAAKSPIGWGPFKITAWQAGQSITLEKNEYYFRASEGYPALDKIEVKFLEAGTPLNDLIEKDGCDVVDDSLIPDSVSSELATLQNDPDLRVNNLPGENWEVLLFGITPASYDDGYYPYGSDRPDLLSDVTIRNAIKQCIDQNAILEQQGIVGNDHPFVYFPYDAQDNSLSSEVVTYDPVSASAVLDAAGWKDYDSNPATPRVSYGVDNVVDGTNFSLNLFTTTSAKNTQIAEAIKNSLTACGIQTTVFATPTSELYAEGPEGILFGRKFDLALISWNVSDALPCELFESEEIPSETNYWIGENDGGGNVTGYQNAEFDSLCTTARFGSSDPEAALHVQIQAAKILDQESPFISFFFNAKTYVANSTLCFLGEKNSEKYPYSSLEYWDFRDTCN
ncbi:MAG: ABC transporter substrate-binding protein [Anaerolineaceae bacterium]